jgi:hypothetical protein
MNGYYGSLQIAYLFGIQIRLVQNIQQRVLLDGQPDRLNRHTDLLFVSNEYMIHVIPSQVRL